MVERTVHDIAPPWQRFYAEGMEALRRRDYGTAVAFFNEVLQREPACFECRISLRTAQSRLAGVGKGLFRRAVNQATILRLLAKAGWNCRSHPLEAIAAAEQVLNLEPRHKAAHRLLAQAALAAHLPQTAVPSLEILCRDLPGNRWAGLRLAGVFDHLGLWAKAEHTYCELLRHRPNDAGVKKALKDLEARRSMEAPSETIGSPAPAASSSQVLEAGRPNAPETAGGATGETALRQPGHDLTSSDAPAAAEDAEGPAPVGKGRGERGLAECLAMVERNPRDPKVRFQLAEAHFEHGDFAAAIKEFQFVATHPHLRIKAWAALGRCFAQCGRFDLADRTLRNALKLSTVFDDQKKELLYALGSLLEHTGQAEQAIEQFKTIYEKDASYQDVATKVEAYYVAKNPSPASSSSSS